MSSNHPPSEEHPGVGPERGPVPPRGRGRSVVLGIIVILIVGALLAVMIYLHASGTLGPDMH
jgi:hypothetical protein